MRAGGCAVQQALAAEAAVVVRQAVTLARRRGHAQVTPLHVASAMLAAGAGVLRAACLQSHSHPLQCKALELCFNVALNRLPAAAIFHHGAAAPAPALSNALVAAFKRAQAHQRRGAVEGQPQSAPPALAAAKVELGQLIISILDDPSVSRVMREAGFSSCQVKANVEKAVSSSDHAKTTTTTSIQGHTKPRALPSGGGDDDDAMRVLDCMASGRRRCVVVVGEGAAAAEGVVKAVMDRVSKAELQPRHGCLKNLQFVPLSVASFHGMPREEVEAKASDLRALVRSGCAAGKGVVLVLEDLAYAADAWAAASEKRRPAAHAQGQGGHHYCSVEHTVVEVSSLVSGSGAGRGLDRFWLLGFGSYPSFIKCRAGEPSLEAVWELHPVVVPDGGLELSLGYSTTEAKATQARAARTGWPLVNAVAAAGESELSCSAGTEAAAATTPIIVPPWLRRYQDPNFTRSASRCTSLEDLWSPVRHGSAPYHTSELTLSFSSPSAADSPAASSSVSGFTRCYNAGLTTSSMPMPWLLEPARPPWTTMAMAPHYHQPQPPSANPSPESMSVSNSSSGSGAPERRRRGPKFTELTAENLKILCGALESGVPPRHRDVAPGVASTVLRCRSGMAPQRRRKATWRRDAPPPPMSLATWLLFQGRDSDGKKTMAQEMARFVFGSYANLTSISAAGADFTAPADHSGDSPSSGDLTLKRQRSPDHDEHGRRHGYVQIKLYEAVRENPHQVIAIDDVDQLDHESEISIKKAIVDGRVIGYNGGGGGAGDEIISLEDAIIVLCCDAFDSRSRVSSSPRAKQRVMINGDGEDEDGGGEKAVRSPCLSLDLNTSAGEDDIIGETEDEEGLLDDDEGILDVVDGVFFFHLTDDL